jgi:hypothetical protein
MACGASEQKNVLCRRCVCCIVARRVGFMEVVCIVLSRIVLDFKNMFGCFAIVFDSELCVCNDKSFCLQSGN